MSLHQIRLFVRYLLLHQVKSKDTGIELVCPPEGVCTRVEMPAGVLLLCRETGSLTNCLLTARRVNGLEREQDDSRTHQVPRSVSSIGTAGLQPC